jgi:hypothetical protein
VKVISTARAPRVGAACVLLAAALCGCGKSRPAPDGATVHGSLSTPFLSTLATAGSTSSVDLAGAVPWIDAPPQPYRPPTATPPPPPATNARPCAAQDVTATFAGGNGAGGHSIIYVNFRNTSQSTCVLKGYPHVTATEPGLPDVAATDGSYFPNGLAANMPPGQDTLLGLETDTYCAARPGGGGGPLYHHIAIVLPGGGTASPAGQSEKFDVTCGLHLTSFFVRQPDAQPPDPLSALKVSLETPSTARAGAALIYVTDLTNPTSHAISLDPCPGYIESASLPAPVKQPYALNGAPVGAIGPTRTIRFEMRMRIPADTPAGPLTIHWTLEAPDVLPESATINIAATPSPALS